MYLTIDVGTQSVRVGIFDNNGTLLAHQAESITTKKNSQGHLTQSSVEIWRCFKKALRQLLEHNNIDVSAIVSIGVSATCSLVIAGEKAAVGLNGDDIILWQCHRAETQAAEINQADYAILKHLGGAISPEHEIPKLMWLKQHQPKIFSAADYFFDLADWFTFKLTNSTLRSICTTTCKWTFNGNGVAWDDNFFCNIGLQVLVDEQYRRIGSRHQIVPVGTSIGTLSSAVAKELHLNHQTKVAAGMIDAHAGALGVLGISSPQKKLNDSIDQKLALIAGTSTCHMALSKRQLFVPGVWGPFTDVILPDMSLSEGGVSASGDLLHKIIVNHHASHGKDCEAIHQELCDIIICLQQNEGIAFPEYLCTNIHIAPFFHGNRSPYADPNLHGAIIGLTMNGGIHELAKLYYATILSLAYNDRAIIDVMNQNGHQIKALVLTGGMTKNSLMMAATANATGLPIIVPQENESVLLGCAIVARIAYSNEKHLDVMQAMSQSKDIILPSNDPKLIDFHQKKYQVFLTLKEQQDNVNAIMHQCISSK